MSKFTPLGVISGLGMAVPERVITNDHFASYLETSDEWISERTGIKERRWAEDGESINDYILKASKEALEDAGLSAADIGAIIVATSTSDTAFPSAACRLQAGLGATGAFAYDIAAACSGFVYGITAAQNHLRAENCENVLLVGAEFFSRVIDKNDRSTCILFGDGVGAVVLSKAGSGEKRGVLGSKLAADGSLGDILYLENPKRGSSTCSDTWIQMQGREVFKSAVRSLADISTDVLKSFGLSAGEIDVYFSHQANSRILKSVAGYLELDEEKVPLNLSKYGNTSAASLPILLYETVKAGGVKEGDLCILSAYGGGAAWGAVALYW